MAARRRWASAAAIVAGVVLAALAALLVPGGAPRAAADRDRPDVVLIMTDDQTVESLRVMPRTRELLAGQGTTFANSFASYPLCCPSRATLLTGQYAHNSGVLGNRPPQGGYEKLRPTADRTLPVWLARAGYQTVHIGKYLNGYGRGTPATEVPPGWTDWQGSVDPFTYFMWGYRLNENGVVRQYGRPRVENPALYQTDVYRDKAVAAIRRSARSDKPLFLSVAFLAPHAEAGRAGGAGATVRSAPRHRGRLAGEPLPRPASFDEADVADKPAVLGQAYPRLRPRQVARIRRAYRGRLESLLAVDEAVAAIVAAQREAGRLDDTLFLFTSDNGFFHGEHRVPNGKYLVYEPSVRVPLIVRGPGIPEGRTSRELVANVDLATTILDAADARPRGRTLDGRSLLPFARRASRRSDRAILLETGQTTDSGDLDQDGGPGVTRPGLRRIPTYRAVRTDRFKYVEYSTGDRELYDLARDPDELQSVHADRAYARTLAALQRELVRLRRCAGSACRRDAGRIPGPSRGGDDDD
jgi:arylsulfatase A-like enzyme